MADVAEKVMGLVGLAGSDNQNEARNAAWSACKLIRRHGLRFGAGGDTGKVRSLEQEVYALRQANRRLEDQLRESRNSSSDDDEPEYRCFDSRYMGRCTVCGKRYAKGDPIWWARGKGAMHDKCYRPEE